MNSTDFPVQTDPHMRQADRGQAARAGVCVIDADAQGVKLALGRDREAQTLAWRELLDAANQAAPGQAGDPIYGAIYGDLYLQAIERLDHKPLAQQGVTVTVDTRTGGATWYVMVVDVAGRHRRDLMRVDEGMEFPHRSQAETERREIAARLGPGAPKETD